MSGAEWIGSLGVTLILLAFGSNLRGILHRDSVAYLGLNLAGALLACLSSALIGFIPFVVLEGVWAMFAVVGLAQRTRAAADQP